MIECIRVALPWRNPQATIDIVLQLVCTHSILIPRFEGLSGPQIKPADVRFGSKEVIDSRLFTGDYAKAINEYWTLTQTVESYNASRGNFYPGRIYLPKESITDQIHGGPLVTLYAVKEHELVVHPYDIAAGRYQDLTYRQNAEATFYEELRKQGIRYNRVNYYLLQFARRGISAVRLELKEL